MDENTKMIWQFILTGLTAIVGMFLKAAFGDLRRLEKNLAEHKTEVARDYATKNDLGENSRQVMARFDRLEEKIDRLVERSKS
jgi:hypothetical protein